MANSGTNTNYYEVLEVAEDAPPHEIHRAYQRAKSTYSSDNPALYSMFSPEEARELLRLIEEAYTVLGNPGLRKSYDESRAKGEISPQVALVIPNYGASQGASSAGSGTGNGHAQAASQSSSHSSSHSSPHSSPQSSQHAMMAQPAPRPAPQPVHQPAPQSQPEQVVQDHRQLPDFPMPSSSIEKSMEMPSSSAKQVLPPGMGRTLLSTFKIDEGFENELKNATDFDGTLLQRTRLYKNISIDRLSEATRISRSYLMAVETNDYKNLPAAVFTRGFVVQVARVLALPEQKVATSYIKMFRAGGGK